jgi:hypothetical protein
LQGELGLGLKGLICQSTNNDDTTKKDKNICNIVRPQVPVISMDFPYPLSLVLNPGDQHGITPPLITNQCKSLNVRFDVLRVETAERLV